MPKSKSKTTVEGEQNNSENINFSVSEGIIEITSNNKNYYILPINESHQLKSDSTQYVVVTKGVVTKEVKNPLNKNSYITSNVGQGEGSAHEIFTRTLEKSKSGGGVSQR